MQEWEKRLLELEKLRYQVALKLLKQIDKIADKDDQVNPKLENLGRLSEIDLRPLAGSFDAKFENKIEVDLEESTEDDFHSKYDPFFDKSIP